MLAISSFKLLAAVFATAYLSTGVKAGFSVDQTHYDSYCGPNAYPEVGVVCFDINNFQDQIRASQGVANGYTTSDNKHLAVVVGEVGNKIVWKTPRYTIQMTSVHLKDTRYPCVSYIITTPSYQGGYFCNGFDRIRLSGQ